MGLPVKDPPTGLDDLMSKIWKDIEVEMKCRSPFDVRAELANGPAASSLFAPVPQFAIPPGLNPQQLMQLVGSVLPLPLQVPPTPYEMISAMMESSRLASRHVLAGNILAVRTFDMHLAANAVTSRMGWENVSLS